MTSTNNKWINIHKHLTKLKCPFIEYLTSPSILFDQGEVRNAVMTWIFSLYNTSWLRKIDNKELSEVSSLTLMASNMGLCPPSDVALVQGGGNHKKQASFWEILIDLVLLKNEIGDTIDSQHSAHVEFMDNISKDSKSIFKETPFKFTFPLPLNPKFEDIPNLEQKVADLTAQVKALQVELNQFEPYNEAEFNWSTDYTEELAGSLQATKQLLVDLNSNYTKEFEPWTLNRPAPPPNPLISLDLKQLIASSHDVLQVMENYKTISNSNVALRQKDDRLENDDIDDVSISALNDKLAVINLYNSNKKKL